MHHVQVECSFAASAGRSFLTFTNTGQVVAVVAAHSGTVLAFQPQCTWIGQRTQVFFSIVFQPCLKKLARMGVGSGIWMMQEVWIRN
jgi:hypothetical protein